MSNGRESERVTVLKTITAAPTLACRNAFDTTALALTDMEQPNIAYGRNYIRLELATDGFLPLPAPTTATPVPRASPSPTPVRLGAETVSTRLDRVRARGMGTLRTADGFVSRDAVDGSRAPTIRLERAPDGAPVTVTGHYLPIMKRTSLGIREVVGWLTVPTEGAIAEPPPTVAPALYVVQRYRLATYARGFGLGDHLYSFTLFPEEEVEIEIKTWKSQEQVDKTGSSIFDGRSDSAESDFENTVQQENSKTSKKDKAFEAHVEASGEASWGWGNASMQAGAKTSAAESTEQFAKNTSSATQKISNKANRERRVEVTQSSEVKTTEGEETRTKRKIRNINKCNTLNFNYFQLVRKYETRLELYDIKVRFASGVPSFDDEDEAWHYDAEEASLSELDGLLERTVTPAATVAVKSLVFRMLSAGDPDDPGLDVLTATSAPERARLDVVPLATTIAWEDAAREAARLGQPTPPKPTAKLPRLMSRDERVIATNAIYADAMLGKCSAGDDFILDSRVLEIEGRQLENRERELGITRTKAELAQFQVDPVPRRVVEVSGLPDGSTVHLHVRDTSEEATHALKTELKPGGGS